MQMNIRYLDGKRFEAQTRGHSVISDQPLDDNGMDTGMTPPELLLASLGTCAGYYAEEYMRARMLPAHGLELHVEGVKGGHPLRIVAFKILVSAHGLNDRHREGLRRAVETCLVHRTLLSGTPAEIEVDVSAPVAV